MAVTCWWSASTLFVGRSIAYQRRRHRAAPYRRSAPHRYTVGTGDADRLSALEVGGHRAWRATQCCSIRGGCPSTTSPDYDCHEVDPSEPGAANVVAVGGRLLAATAYPRHLRRGSSGVASTCCRVDVSETRQGRGALDLLQPARRMTPTLREQFDDIDIYLFDQLLRGRIAPGMRVLDAGCGRGRNLVYLLRAGFDVSAVDADPEAVAEVRALAARLAPRLPASNIRVERVEAMTVPDAGRRRGHQQRGAALRARPRAFRRDGAAACGERSRRADCCSAAWPRPPG